MDALALVTAAALLVVGAAAVAVRAVRLGATAVAVGVCLPVLVQGIEPGSPLIMAPLAAAVVPLLGPVVAWGVLEGQHDTAVRIAVLAGIVAGPVRTVLYDAYFDPECVIECPTNPLALAHGSGSLHDALRLVALAAAAALSAYAVAQLAARRPHRLAAVAVASACWVLALRPADPLPPATAIAVTALVVASALVSRAFQVRARMTELARAFEQAADIEATLAAAIRDPELTVTYVLDGGLEVRPDGSPPRPEPGTTATDLVGIDGVVARVHHSSSAVDTARLADAVRGPGRLALENGRLAAQVRLKAVELEGSRRRLVEHADTERRRLERDLHDSAQQHVLALGLALGGALSDLEDDADRAVVEGCLASTRQVLDELRELSHGFFPAALEQSGLRDALDGVIDRARVSVTLVAVPAERLSPEVERAIYLLVARAALTARRPVTVGVRRHGADVVTVISGAGAPDEVLRDVFAVLGGSIVAEDAGDAGAITATLPVQQSGSAR